MKIGLKTAVKFLNSFRLSANQRVFEDIFGDEEIRGRKVWELHYEKFMSLQYDVIAFWTWLDESYKEVFMKLFNQNLSKGEDTE